MSFYFRHSSSSSDAHVAVSNFGMYSLSAAFALSGSSTAPSTVHCHPLITISYTYVTKALLVHMVTLQKQCHRFSWCNFGYSRICIENWTLLHSMYAIILMSTQI